MAHGSVVALGRYAPRPTCWWAHLSRRRRHYRARSSACRRGSSTPSGLTPPVGKPSDLLDRRAVYDRRRGRVNPPACRDKRRTSQARGPPRRPGVHGAVVPSHPRNGSPRRRNNRRVQAALARQIGSLDAPFVAPTRPDDRRVHSGMTRSAQGERRITTRGVPDAAFDVDGAATTNPARSNIAAVPRVDGRRRDPRAAGRDGVALEHARAVLAGVRHGRLEERASDAASARPLRHHEAVDHPDVVARQLGQRP